MGVLMSKKQQVEKVQKCNTVISAFKEGLKDRPAPPSQADGSTGGVAKGADSAPWTRAAKEGNEPKGDAGNPKPSNDAPGEEGRANPGSWSRLRDGKGVEPEEMDGMNQLTPPAFVRPKRRVEDDQPLELDLNQGEQPVNEGVCEVCDVCEVWTADDLYPCRTCRRVFHDGCLREMGYLSTIALQEMRESAHTAAGWSCYYCDNVNLLLTEEEMCELLGTFKQCKIIPESCLASDDFLHYKRQLEKDLSDEQEEEVMLQFSALDPEKRGSVGWTDFLYHESLGTLRKLRTPNSLVRLLTPKERDRARVVFVGLDLDRDGLVTWGEVQRAQQSWFQKQAQEAQSCNVRLRGLCSPLLSLSISHVGPISENSPASSTSGRSQEKEPINSEKEDNRPMSWQEFLTESAIYILAARPNSPALHLRPPL